MSAIWQEAACKRPDPYLEWEYRTRRIQDETWCSVQIQVVKTDEGYLANLCRLEKAVKDGKQDDDVAIPELFTIRMADDERANLQDWIKAIKCGVHPDEMDMRFFIYRLEAFIYDAGQYRSPAFYEILIAGPPISDLTFNERNTGTLHPVILPDSGVLKTTVAIGIIDDGIAFAHERFRSGPFSSRIQALWLQEIESRRDPDNGVLFGKRLNKADIDALLSTCKSEDEIYRRVGVTDFGSNINNPLASRASHGTHVLDLAGGGDALSDTRRPIFAVQLPSAATIDTSGVTMGSYVLQAVRMIMLWADKYGGRGVPLVINFSYGLLAGPKDGGQQLEHALAELIHHRNYRKHKKKLRTRLVLPAGNSYRARAVARMNLKGSQSKNLDWVILPDDGTANFLEIWLDGDKASPKCAGVEIALTSPGETTGTAIRPRKGFMRELMINKRPVAGIYYDVVRHGTKIRERILLAINPTVRNMDNRDLAPAGRWNVSIKNLTKGKITAHLYIQRDDTPFGYPRRGRQSCLDDAGAYERDPNTGDYRRQARNCPIIYEDTLSSLATCSMTKSDHAIVVGAAEATDHYPPADYTSSGPTQLRKGPDCSAFAEEGDAHWGILAAGTFSGSVVPMRGTSVAAPQIVREVANQLATGTSTPIHGIPVAREDQARLGKAILPMPENPLIRRRYPL